MSDGARTYLDELDRLNEPQRLRVELTEALAEVARLKVLLAEFGSVRSSLEQNWPTKENEMAVKLSSQASRDAHVASLKAPPTAPPAVVCLDDVCECGDYRKQHEFSGSCAVCRDVPAPWNGCKRFRFASRSHDHDGARCLPTSSADSSLLAELEACRSELVSCRSGRDTEKAAASERDLGAEPWEYGVRWSPGDAISPRKSLEHAQATAQEYNVTVVRRIYHVTPWEPIQ